METIDVIEVTDTGTSFDRNSFEDMLNSNLNFANPELLSREVERRYLTKNRLEETNPSILARNIAETRLVEVAEGERLTFVVDKQVNGLLGNYAPGSTITMERFHSERDFRTDDEKVLASELWAYMENTNMTFSDDDVKTYPKRTSVKSPKFEQFVFVELEQEIVDLLNIIFGKLANKLDSRDLEHILLSSRNLGLTIEGKLANKEELRDAIFNDLTSIVNVFDAKRQVTYQEFRDGQFNKLKSLVEKLPNAERYLSQLEKITSIEQVTGLPKDIMIKMSNRIQCGFHDALFKKFNKNKTLALANKLKKLSTVSEHLHFCNHCKQRILCDHNLDYFKMPIENFTAKYAGKKISHFIYCKYCNEEIYSTKLDDELSRVTFESFVTNRETSSRYGEDYDRKSSLIFGSVSSVIGKLKSKKDISYKLLIRNIHKTLVSYVLSIVTNMKVESENLDNMIRLVGAVYASVAAMKIFMSSADFYIPELSEKSESKFIQIFIKDIHNKFSKIADVSFISNIVRKAYASLKKEQFTEIQELSKAPDVVSFVESSYFRSLFEMYQIRTKVDLDPLVVLSRILNKRVTDIRICDDITSLTAPTNLTDREKQIYKKFYDPEGFMFNAERETVDDYTVEIKAQDSIDRKTQFAQKIYPLEYHYDKNGKQLIWELKKVKDIKTKPMLMSTGIFNDGTKHEYTLVANNVSISQVTSKNRKMIEKTFSNQANYVVVKFKSDSVKKSNSKLKDSPLSAKNFTLLESMNPAANMNILRNIGRTIEVSKNNARRGNFDKQKITMEAVKIVTSYVWSISKQYNNFINNIDGESQLDFYNHHNIKFSKILEQKSFPKTRTPMAYQDDYTIEANYNMKMNELVSLLEIVKNAPLIGKYLVKDYILYITKSEMTNMKNEDPKKSSVFTYGDDDDMKIQSDAIQDFEEEEDSENEEI